MSRGIILTLVIAAAFAILRIAGVNNVFFKDAAHIYVGGLFGAAFVLWSLSAVIRCQVTSTLEVRMGYESGKAEYIVKVFEEKLHAVAKFYLGLGVILTVVETLVAVLSRIF